jgi:hypothetical protein
MLPNDWATYTNQGFNNKKFETFSFRMQECKKACLKVLEAYLVGMKAYLLTKLIVGCEHHG